MERLENRSDVRELGRLRNSSSRGVDNELKTIKLTIWKIEKKRIAVVYLRVYERGSNGFGS
jgi:hypothetical protein